MDTSERMERERVLDTAFSSRRQRVNESKGRLRVVIDREEVKMPECVQMMKDAGLYDMIASVECEIEECSCRRQDIER